MYTYIALIYAYIDWYIRIQRLYIRIQTGIYVYSIDGTVNFERSKLTALSGCTATRSCSTCNIRICRYVYEYSIHIHVHSVDICVCRLIYTYTAFIYTYVDWNIVYSVGGTVDSTSALSPAHMSWRTRRRTMAWPCLPITSSMFIDLRSPFGSVNSPTNPSTYCLLFLVMRLSWRFCGGVDLREIIWLMYCLK